MPGLLPGERTVLYAGRLTREKGVDLLADAFLAARALDPGLHLVLAGGGPEEEALRDRLGEHATFLGWLEGDDLARAYASADIFLFPSRTDTFGQVVLEAQASGLPVIAVDEGGPATLVRDGATGLLRPSDPDALGAAVAGLAADQRTRDRLARAGARRRRGPHVGPRARAARRRLPDRAGAGAPRRGATCGVTATTRSPSRSTTSSPRRTRARRSSATGSTTTGSIASRCSWCRRPTCTRSRRRAPSSPSGCWSARTAATRSRSTASRAARPEFARLDQEEARRAVDSGRRLLKLAGVEPLGFVAPGYAYTPALRATVRERYAWWADLMRLHRVAGRDSLAPAVRLSPLALRAGALLGGPLLRIDLRPSDLDHTRHMLALERVLRRARRRTAVTYDELAAA